ncbi:tigger transposable element-derived protein 4-like [Littorina saxatilis]|uniref:tigger transposable element-derived protein 4-like n=1 Tax=Littorina saxatilis TaxID=31220 RepID=UPI0038B4ABC5
MLKRKRESCSLEKKRIILADVDENVLKKCEIAEKYAIPKSTLSTVINKGKRLKIQTFYLRFATELGIDNFVASNGWLDRFKKRKGVVYKSIYHPNDIYNADETGLFYCCLPNKTLAMKGENCPGGKQSKERLTVIVCANMSGTDRIPLFVIGKFAKPRCFSGIGTLPCQYASNRKAWMTSVLFEGWKEPGSFHLNVLDAMYIARSAWRSVSEDTISNCFRHAGFVAMDAESVSQPQPSIQSDTCTVPARYHELDEEVPFSDYVNMDEGVSTTEIASIRDIVHSVQGEASQDGTASDSGEDDDPEPLPTPTATEARVAANTQRRYLQAKCRDVCDLDMISKLECTVEKCASSEQRQTNILDFFKTA